MERVVVTGGELDAEARGSGEPVLLIHGAITPHTWAPLLHQTVLSEGYRLIHYHRRGFAGSTHVEPLQHEVEDALTVLRHFGVEKALGPRQSIWSWRDGSSLSRCWRS